MKNAIGFIVLLILVTTVFIFILSCGRKRDSVTPNVVSVELKAEIDRISPLLYWCDGLSSNSASNNIDGRPHCDTGDGWAEAGFITLIGNSPNKPAIFNALKNSFGANGQPFRSPSYVDKDGQNAFSRDQLLGAMNATIAGFPAEDGLSRILDYSRRTGKLCPTATDNKCWVSPEMKILSKYVLGQSVTDVERGVLEEALNIEAQTAPIGYQTTLVANKVYALTRMGRLTTRYAHAVATLHKRVPLNMWYHTLYLITNNGKQADFDAVAARLTACMKTWVEPGIHWSWSSEEECIATRSGGHELVAVARLLLRVEEGEELALDLAQ